MRTPRPRWPRRLLPTGCCSSTSGAADRLAAEYAASLAKVPNGVGKVHGRWVGEAAAAAVIALRVGDGRGADLREATPAPGVWRPTPPANAPMLVPWLGFVRPLALTSPAQIALPGPDPITSAAYATDFAEVKAFGRKDGSSRSAGQTETALFFNYNSVLQYQEGMRKAVTERGLDILDSARAFYPAGHLDGRLADRVLAGEVRLRVLAADHGDPAGRHRRQRGDRARPRLGATGGHTAVRRLRERARLHYRGGVGHLHADQASSDRPDLVLRCDEHEPGVQHRQQARRGHHERTDLAEGCTSAGR